MKPAKSVNTKLILPAISVIDELLTELTDHTDDSNGMVVTLDSVRDKISNVAHNHYDFNHEFEGEVDEIMNDIIRFIKELGRTNQ